MNITKNEQGVFTIDEKVVGTLEDAQKAVADATTALAAAQTALTDAQIVEDAIIHYVEPVKEQA